MAKPYGFPNRDGPAAPKLKDKGVAEDGLSMIEKINIKEYPLDEQARWKAGERNESLPGGWKLVQ